MIPSFQPTAHQEMCLRAGLLDGEAACLAWHHVRAVGLENLDAGARSLLPLVYMNLARLGAAAEEIDALRERYIVAGGENQRIGLSALSLLRALGQADIEAVVLKGLALVARFYRDPGLRPMADVDVLVRASDAARAGDVAAHLGWRPRYDMSDAFRRVRHAAPFDHPSGVACDIHWRIFEEAGGDAVDDEVRAAVVPVLFQGTRLQVLSPTDQLLHVCGHAARWTPAPAIRWVADAVVIVREGPIDWPRLVRHTVRRRFVLRMREMLGYLRRTLAVAVPPSVEADLARQPVSGLERLEYRVRQREHRLLGEFPAYVFNCFRGEARPLLALPGYLRDAWGLESLAGVPRRALTLAVRRLRKRAAGRA